jgi:sucrose-6F-phosphate phosphohydrolase
VDHADHESKSLLRFGALWQAEYNHDSLLVFSTGRSPTLYFELRSEVPLLTPGIAIMSVGTEIMYGDTMTPDYGWVEELSQGWDRSAVVEVANEMQLKYQCDSEQRPHKVSFHVKKEESVHVIPMLTQKLEARGVSPFSVSSALSCVLQTYPGSSIFCNASVSYSIFVPLSLRFQNNFLPRALTRC